MVCGVARSAKAALQSQRKQQSQLGWSSVSQPVSHSHLVRDRQPERDTQAARKASSQPARQRYERTLVILLRRRLFAELASHPAPTRATACFSSPTPTTTITKASQLVISTEQPASQSASQSVSQPASNSPASRTVCQSSYQLFQAICWQSCILFLPTHLASLKNTRTSLSLQRPLCSSTTTFFLNYKLEEENVVDATFVLLSNNNNNHTAPILSAII